MSFKSWSRDGTSMYLFVILLLTRCYCVFAILERKVHVDEEPTRNFSLEDLLRIGTDKEHDENEAIHTETTISWHRTTFTVYHTTTIMSTATIIYNPPVSTEKIQTLKLSTQCDNDVCTIKPTPTIKNVSSTSASPITEPSHIPDERYWLITKLKSNGSAFDFVSDELEENLAKLYKTAFHRQQAHHLGLTEGWNVSGVLYVRRARDNKDTVTVQIHNITTDGVVQVLYSVRVSGQPVLATAAAQDMRLISDAEFAAELGYPILTKAEPYLKFGSEKKYQPLHSENILIVIGSAVGAICLFTLVCLLLLITFKKYKQDNKTEHSNTMESRNSIPDNSPPSLPQSDNLVAATSTEQEHNQQLKDSSSIELSNSNSHGLKAHIYKVPSSNSYLSMPSVKSFPSTSFPQPLINLLSSNNSLEETNAKAQLVRHHSESTKDPGVIGPSAWHMKKNFAKQDSVNVEDASSIDIATNVHYLDEHLHKVEEKEDTPRNNQHSSMSQRALSRDSPSESCIDQKSQLVLSKKSDESCRDCQFHFRPKTSVHFATRDGEEVDLIPKTRGAWGNDSPEMLARAHSMRPSSATSFHRPVVQPELILTDAHLPPHDPAITIIAAIRQELKKIPQKAPTPK